MLNTMMSTLDKRVILVRTAVESVMARGRLETNVRETCNQTPNDWKNSDWWGSNGRTKITAVYAAFVRM